MSILTAIRNRVARPIETLSDEAVRLKEKVATVPFWFHTHDLGCGVMTPGHKTPQILQHELKVLRWPDLHGKSVLDIGAWDGFFSFEAERRGASRVVALDHYVWGLDREKYQEYCVKCQREGITAKIADEVPEVLDLVNLPGKRGFDIAHEAFNSQVETAVGDFMEMDLAQLGPFDVVFYFGVLYHMRHPLAALQRVASVTKQVAIIETAAITVPGKDESALCEFYETTELNGDPTNWWAPNRKALEALLRAAGFRRVEILSTPIPSARCASGEIVRHRLHAHAYK